MSRLRIGLAFATAIVLAATLVSGSAAADPKLFALMTGAQEIPRADPYGHARATITLKRTARRVCFDIRKTGIATAQAGHIHRGVKGHNGPIYVPLFASARRGGRITGCARNVSRMKIDAITRNPRGFYVNIHTRKYPEGAARGQLSCTRPR